MKQRAFTLIEVLVALAILSVGLVPAFYHATSAILLASRTRDSLISANLAQEGIEIVRSMRDANWFNNLGYDEGLADTCRLGCSVQHNSAAVGSESGPLRLDPATGLYQYTTGAPTPYTRTITITPDGGGLRVDSTVAWQSRGQPRVFTVRAYLFNWLK